MRGSLRSAPGLASACASAPPSLSAHRAAGYRTPARKTDDREGRRGLAVAQVMRQRGAFEGQLVAFAIERRIEQQIRQQRLVEKAAREIMRDTAAREPLAALDLDLIAIERGVERRRDGEIVPESGVADEGFERRPRSPRRARTRRGNGACRTAATGRGAAGRRSPDNARADSISASPPRWRSR